MLLITHISVEGLQIYLKNTPAQVPSDEFCKKKKNDFLTGHLVAASFESISANGAEILNNTPVQQSFQKWFYLLSYVQI